MFGLLIDVFLRVIPFTAKLSSNHIGAIFKVMKEQEVSCSFYLTLR